MAAGTGGTGAGGAVAGRGRDWWHRGGRRGAGGTGAGGTGAGGGRDRGQRGRTTGRRAGMADSDVIVVGAGLAGLVATAELADAGRRVLLLDQEPAANLGGQAFWSFGGLFLVNSPEQRRFGIKDSFELARQDWLGSAGFDRGLDDPAGPDYWAYRWAEAYLDFAAGEKRSWLHGLGLRWVPLVFWAERGGQLADGAAHS